MTKSVKNNKYTYKMQYIKKNLDFIFIFCRKWRGLSFDLKDRSPSKFLEEANTQLKSTQSQSVHTMLLIQLFSLIWDPSLANNSNKEKSFYVM